MRCRTLLVMVVATALSVAAPVTAADGEPQALIELGRDVFFDASLSEPPGTSCASCHAPEGGFSSTNGSKLGVPRGSRAGHFARRASPSLLYLRYVPRFRFFQEGDDPGVAPVGGLFWDGRVDTITELARQPLLNPDEMNGKDGATVAAKIARASYGGAFARAFPRQSRDPEATLNAVGVVLEAFLTTDDMAPFSSFFDDVVRRKATFTALEAEGLRLFKGRRQGRLRVVPSRRRGSPRSGIVAVHRLRLRRGGRSHERQGAAVEAGPRALRATRHDRAVERRDVLHQFPDSVVTQRRGAEVVHAQWRVHQSARGRTVLRDSHDGRPSLVQVGCPLRLRAGEVFAVR